MANCIEKNFEGAKLEKAKALKEMYENVPQMAKKKAEGKAEDINQKQQDVYKDAWLNPLKYAEEVVAAQNNFLSSLIDLTGGALIDVASPVVKKGHKALKNKSPMYRDTVNLIRTGFLRSDLAQSMTRVLGYSGDINEEVVNEVLQINTSVDQILKTYLDTELPNLEAKINKAYTSGKDRVKLFQIFARTGIANLSNVEEVAEGIMKGTMTVDEAIKLVEKQVKLDDKINRNLDDLVNYYLNGVNETGATNTKELLLGDPKYDTLVALRALKRIEGAEKMLKDMDLELKEDLYNRTAAIKAQSDEINHRQVDENGRLIDAISGLSYMDYDGHMMKDIHDERYEYAIVNEHDMRTGKYSSKDEWKVVTKPNDEKHVLGVMARVSLKPEATPGVGLSADRFNNGFYINEEDSKRIRNIVNEMPKSKRKQFLLDNNLSDSGGGRYRIKINERQKVKDLGMKQSLAHALVRTFVHNAELIQMQSVRDIITDKATETINTKEDMMNLAKKLARNAKKHPADQEVVPMFLKINMDYESYDKLPTWVKMRYTPPRGLSTYNGFNKKITLVRTSVKDEMLGHPNWSMFGEKGPRTLGKIEKVYKELVIMAKQKMVITNPSKLAMDAISNIGILGMKDVNIIEMKRGFYDGMKYYKEFSEIRSEMAIEMMRVKMGEENSKNKLKVLEHKMKNHKFYKAYQMGFVQSYSTSLVAKEYDTLTGLQADINKLVEGLTKDKNGNPNELFNAVKKWQNLGASKGMNVDTLIGWASEISKVKGTEIGAEMKAMADRLERHRNDPESVAAYVSEIIGGPSSEVVRMGGAVMVTMDVLSKYTLAEALKSRTNPKTKKQYTENEAYIEANNTFIDYRKNVPQEIKVLSDYGILMFPSFWLRAQKIILGLVHYHPGTAIGSYMIADALDVSGASFLDVNIINKINNGTVINEPTNLIDWEAISPWVGLLK